MLSASPRPTTKIISEASNRGRSGSESTPNRPDQRHRSDSAARQRPARAGAGRPGGAPNGGQPQPEETPEKKSGRKFIIIGVVILLILAAGFWYWRSTFTEDTDDAQVDGDIYQVSSRIAGQVISVHVQDNTQVNKGDLLVEIDPKDAQVALEQAQAALASAQAEYTQANVNVPITSTTTTTALQNSGVDVRATATSVTQAQQAGRRRSCPRRRGEGQRDQGAPRTWSATRRWWKKTSSAASSTTPP